VREIVQPDGMTTGTVTGLFKEESEYTPKTSAKGIKWMLMILMGLGLEFTSDRGKL
jgi:hypothetical protein